MKDDRIVLAHVRVAIKRIEAFTSGGRDQFFASPLVHSAVIRNSEMIDKAVKRLSEGI